MNDRDFELRLRDFYRAEADTAAAPQVELLHQSVWAIPEDVPVVARGFFSSRRGVVLVAAALLTALLVGGAVAVGAGLLKLPWLPDEVPDTHTRLSAVSPELLKPTPCDQTLAESVLLSVVISGPSGPPMQTLVYESGMALVSLEFDRLMSRTLGAAPNRA